MRKDGGSMEEVHDCNERKRPGKGKGSADADSILKKQVITVQKYTSELTGKLQKYARMGPQQFVSLESWNKTTMSIISDVDSFKDWQKTTTCMVAFKYSG